MTKVSVIIPAYNAAKYIEKCLDSVINQTLADIEIICIDDGSSDCTYDILCEYCKRDYRIKIFKNEKNFGLSYTRNRGINASSGEYIQFVDSDDYIDNNMLEDLYNVAIKNNLELLKTQVIWHKNDLLFVREKGCEQCERKAISGEQLFLMHPRSGNMSQGFFLKRNFLLENNVLFLENIVHEDILFAYQVYKKVKRAMYYEKSYYHYLTNNSGITKLTDKNSSSISLIKILDYIQRNDEKTKFDMIYLAILKSAFERNLCSTVVPIDFEQWPKELKEITDLFLGEQYIDYKKIDSIEKNCFKEMDVYIYGAGVAGKQLLEILNMYDVCIKGFVESKKTRHTFMGHSVFSKSEIIDKYKTAFFLIAISKIGEKMELELKEEGFLYVLNVAK